MDKNTALANAYAELADAHLELAQVKAALAQAQAQAVSNGHQIVALRNELAATQAQAANYRDQAADYQELLYSADHACCQIEKELDKDAAAIAYLVETHRKAASIRKEALIAYGQEV